MKNWMNFPGKVLVKLEGEIAETCWLDEVGEGLKIPIDGTDDPVGKIQRRVRGWTTRVGQQYVDRWSNTKDAVNCPEGNLLLPIDRWHCKHTGEHCPIGARISLNDKEGFLNGCNLEIAADELDKDPWEYKEGIWQAINRGEYSGGHHKVGRYPCPFCEEDGRDHYLRFPWELTNLSNHIEDYDAARTDRDFVVEGLAFKLSHAICADCFLGLQDRYPSLELSQYGLDLDQFVGIEFTFEYQ